MTERPTICPDTNEAPAGSLCALGGDDRIVTLLDLPINQIRQMRQILDGSPEKAANILLNQASS